LSLFKEIIPPENELRWQYFKASGPGGQRRNKVATGVRLTHLPTGLTVTATERRLRQQNKKAALARLSEKLIKLQQVSPPRRPTRPTAASRQRRLAGKRRIGRLKAERGRTGHEDL